MTHSALELGRRALAAEHECQQAGEWSLGALVQALHSGMHTRAKHLDRTMLARAHEGC